MAEGKVEFELVSPEHLVLSEPVEMVVVPGTNGDFGVLPGHSPLLSTVRMGIIAIYEAREIVNRIFVAGGFAEVTADRCTVLADVAMPVQDIDGTAVEARLREAREDERIASTEEERAAAAYEIALAEAQLEASRMAPSH